MKYTVMSTHGIHCHITGALFKWSVKYSSPVPKELSILGAASEGFVVSKSTGKLVI